MKHSEWGGLSHFFEWVEFQNHGAAHTHGVYWISKTIEQMINKNLIRSDLPDPITEMKKLKQIKKDFLILFLHTYFDTET